MFQLFPLLGRDAQDFAQASTNAQRLAYPENNFTVTAIQALKGSGVQSLARVVSPDCAGDSFSDRAATSPDPEDKW